jgi:hypothetical protein
VKAAYVWWYEWARPAPPRLLRVAQTFQGFTRGEGRQGGVGTRRRRRRALGNELGEGGKRFGTRAFLPHLLFFQYAGGVRSHYNLSFNSSV